MIETPCIRHCTLDDADRCVGCERTVGEIMRWTSMTPEQRRAVMAELPGRAALRRGGRRT